MSFGNMYTELKLFIDGQWLEGAGRISEGVVNPATGAVLAQLPHASKSDLDAAIGAAQRGFKVWKSRSAYERWQIMRSAAELIRARADHIASIQTLEQGKVLTESRLEVLASADVVDWYAEEGRRAYGRIVPGRARGTRQIVLQEPVGVVAAFTPWNFPTLTPARKLAGALAAGCSIIIKASEETPGGCLELVRCFVDAGVPAGVINMVFGVPAEVSEHLLHSEKIRKVSFTGSIQVGKQLTALAAKTMKRVTMELGGHAPVIVFDDADAEKVADAVAPFKYRNAGQVCISPTRFYVQDNSYRKFVARFAEYAGNLRLGDGMDSTSTMGPLANSRRLDAMDAIVADSKTHGGKLVVGGKRCGNGGYFFQPTVITDLPDDSMLMTQEPFGPIAPIVRFKTFDEVVERSNSLPFGLAAYAFTASSATAQAIGDEIEAGMVGVNSMAVSTPETPFGGVKESGYGSEGGLEGLQAFLNTKFVSQA
jgi:succinate-semialdehyde dehydrogenase/glutarate-semialdehyde dehydrogenase